MKAGSLVMCVLILPIKRPLLRQRLNQIRPRLRQLIIHPPATGQLTLSAFRRGAEREQRNDIALIGMENLLISRVRRGANALFITTRCAEILDVVHDDVSRLALELDILSPSYWSDMRREAGVDDDVFFPGVLVDGEAAEDSESVAVVEVLGDVSQCCVQVGEREGVLVDVADGFIQCCIQKVYQHSSNIYG